VFWIFLALKTLTLIGKKLSEMQRLAIIIAAIKPQLGVNPSSARMNELQFDDLLEGKCT